MKPLPLILSFLPLIAFSLLTRLLPSGDIGVAALVAALCAAVATVAVRPVWPPKVLNAASLLLFAALAAAGFASGAGTDRWLDTWGGAGVGIVLGLVILVLVPVVPFTEQFARQTTPKAYWTSPTFKKINRVLSAAWGVAIVAVGASRVAAAVIGRGTSHRLPDLLLGTALPIVIVVYMLKFSKSYPDRITQGEAGAPAVS
jgi:hypothetical protein